MAITAEERIRNELGSDRGSITYLVRDAAGGTVTADAAITAAATASPSAFNGLPRRDANTQELFTNIWDVTILYSLGDFTFAKPTPDTGDVDYEFDIGLETIHITQSLGTKAQYMDPALVAQGLMFDGSSHFGGAIDVTADLNVEGTDIFVPTARLSLRYRAPNAVITDGYQQTVEGLVGSVNEFTYRGRAAGTLLFAGASGQRHNAEAWDLAFQFIYRPNVVEKIGDIEDVTADGWDHIWVMYLTSKSEGTKSVIKKPAYVFVEQIYRRNDFSALGLPA